MSKINKILLSVVCVILIAILISAIFIGVYNGKGGKTVVVINGQKFSRDDFIYYLELSAENLWDYLGTEAEYDYEIEDGYTVEDYIKFDALEYLRNLVLIQDKAAELGYYLETSDEEYIDYMESIYTGDDWDAEEFIITVGIFSEYILEDYSEDDLSQWLDEQEYYTTSAYDDIDLDVVLG